MRRRRAGVPSLGKSPTTPHDRVYIGRNNEEAVDEYNLCVIPNAQDTNGLQSRNLADNKKGHKTK